MDSTKLRNLNRLNWVKVRKDDVLLPNGEEIEDFYVVSFHEAVAIAALDCDGDLILTNQYRHSYNRDLIEIPAETFEENETDSLAVTKRELLEETGYVSDEWLYFGATEELDVMVLPLEEEVEMVMNNEVCYNSSAHGIPHVARMLRLL